MNDYYRQHLQMGLEYQDFVIDQLCKHGIFIGAYSSRKYQLEKGESVSGIEIKYDGKMKGTGNLYIEVEEKSDEQVPNYSSSGIFRKDNTWLYLIGNYDEAFMFSKVQLQRVYLHNLQNMKRGEPLWNGVRLVETPTSRGFTYNVEVAKSKSVIKHFVFNT
ncbi:MAG: hypothetical protein II008_09370 [Oscillospiraceae bacterium]|nr:hypothetical protein [Oscillospiraceae bacterium]